MHRRVPVPGLARRPRVRLAALPDHAAADPEPLVAARTSRGPRRERQRVIAWSPSGTQHLDVGLGRRTRSPAANGTIRGSGPVCALRLGQPGLQPQYAEAAPRAEPHRLWFALPGAL